MQTVADILCVVYTNIGLYYGALNLSTIDHSSQKSCNTGLADRSTQFAEDLVTHKYSIVICLQPGCTKTPR